MEDRIKEAILDAEECIWESIVDNFPEAEGGDLSIGATIDLSMAIENAITEWVSNNVEVTDE